MNRTAKEPEHLHAELMCATPRPARLTGLGTFVAGLAFLLLAGVALTLVLLPPVAAQAAEQKARFEREAVAGVAEIVEVGPPRGKDRRRTIKYRFEAGGQVQEGRVTLKRSRSRELAVGSRVPVRYLPSDSKVNYILGRAPGGLPLWVVPVVAGLFGLGAALAGWSIRRQRALLAEGRPSLATVTGSTRGHKGIYTVEFEYPVLSGAVMRGSYQDSKTPPGAGSTLVVLYDRERPDRVSRYPLSLVRLDGHS